MGTVYTDGTRRNPSMWVIKSWFLACSRLRRGATALEQALLIILITAVFLSRLAGPLMQPIERLGRMLQNFLLPRP